MRILITGSGGFIGQAITRRLQADPALEIVAAVRAGPGPTAEGRRLACDLATPASVEAALAHDRWDMVINCAGLIDQSVRPGIYREQWEANVRPVVNLADALERLQLGRRVAVLHLGSNAEYGDAPCAQRGDGPCRPNSAYGWAKLAATEYLMARRRSEGWRTAVVRPFLVYGAGMSPRSFLAQAIHAARTGGAFPTSPGGQSRDFVSVEAVAETVWRMVKAPDQWPSVPVNACTGIRRTLQDVLGILHSLAPAFKPQLGAIPYRDSELMETWGVPAHPVDQAEADRDLREFIRHVLQA